MEVWSRRRTVVAQRPRNVDAGRPACVGVQPRLALGLALGSAALAISAVTVDLAYELEAFLDTQDEGGWRTVATSDPEAPSRIFDPGCGSQTFRLRVHNDRLVASTVEVHISYSGPSAGQTTILHDTWRLGRGETRTYEFSVPDSAFEQAPDGYKPYVGVNAQVGDLYLGACVEEAA